MKKTTIVIMAALALGAAGCKKKKKPAPSPSPTASASPGAGASPTPTATPSPSASAPATPPAGGPQVVLTDAGGEMVQLGCWDPDKKAIVDDESCLKAAPDVVELVDSEGKTMTTTKKQEVVFCEIEGEEPDKNWGFAMPEGVGASVAVYPKDAPVKLTGGSGDSDATPAQLKAAFAALSASLQAQSDSLAKGKKTKVVLKDPAALVTPAVDLDGDGKPEMIITVQADQPRPEEPDLPTQQSGLYADFGDGKLVELFVETGTPSGGIDIEGYLDLGADGRTEIVVKGHWNGGYRESIIFVGPDRKPQAVGSIGCDS